MTIILIFSLEILHYFLLIIDNEPKMAIINIDVRGFSKLAAEMEPSHVMQLLSTYQGRVVPILKQNGAIIDKFMGDGIMIFFGDPQTAGTNFLDFEIIKLKGIAS